MPAMKERVNSSSLVLGSAVIGKKMTIHPLTYERWNTSPITYEIGFFTSQLSKAGQITTSSGFGWQFAIIMMVLSFFLFLFCPNL
jgi:hypothetical protein